AQVVSFVRVAVSMALTVPLGWWATLAHLGFLSAGWVYNVGLKATPASVFAYVVGFGLLPCVVTLALPDPRLPAAWVVAVGVLLGVAAHFANVLPDAEGDRLWGSRGLPQLAGKKISIAVIVIAVMLSGVVALLGFSGRLLLA
ncbi:MAG: 1,4-dihydroxy-2-naphthoate prenyltransferase, partial [Rhodoglobus sp.]